MLAISNGEDISGHYIQVASGSRFQKAVQLNRDGLVRGKRNIILLMNLFLFKHLF
jgi:hypothetical protein